MRIALTGHTSGIGKAIVQQCQNGNDTIIFGQLLWTDGEPVLGFSRSNGYDINDPAPIIRETLAKKFKVVLKNNGVKDSNISAVGGPCLATGLAGRIKSSVVLANSDLSVVKSIGKMISTNYYSTEYSEDLLGVEVCAAIKNLYSMIIGASEGLCSVDATEDVKNKNYLNTAASLMYKSISEMVYFTKALKGKKETVYGLSGLGDLYVSSAGGRNSKMGKYLGEGHLYSKAKKQFMQNDTIEGAELAFEIGSKIMKEFSKNDLPLMINLLDSIINNKKFKINW